MTNEFSQLTLHPDLLKSAAELGFETPTEVQTQVIPLMLEGKDVLAQSQTGSGKTAAFAYPILENLINSSDQGCVNTLVLTPTRELAIQVADAISQYGRHQKVQVLPVYGGQHYGTSRRRLKEGVDVIVGTPGRLQDLIRQGILDLSKVRTVILDEADEMLSMGFVDDVENILRETPSQRQTTLFSATLPKSIRLLADKYMKEPETVMIHRKQVTVDTIEQRYYLVNEKDKLAAITRLFEIEEVGATLVFTKTRVGSGRVANKLIQRGFSAEALNGDLAQDARIRVLDRFRSGQIKVLVATDVAARGLDIDDISHVFNFDIPTDPELYVHRIGRTARAGKKGIAISLVSPGDKRYLGRIGSFTKYQIPQAEFPTIKDIEERREIKLLEKMEVWLERDRCKREQELAEYLVASGHDPIKVAAAAIKMARGEEKQRRIEKISEVRINHSREKNSGRKQYSRNGKSRSHRGQNPRSSSQPEKGMVSLNLSRGRQHGINPGEIVGGIASLADIPGNGIGKISIFDKYTLLDVKEEYVSNVLGKTGSYHFHDNHNVDIKRVSN
ncbi:MAG: DEAD/DEAH box helicase [Anaerolineales bacterium]|nr:DEAD/DEAH box helicase [Anaerolineales bacterium]